MFTALDLQRHDLRHEYAVAIDRARRADEKIPYLLGHASVVTTERDIHYTLAELVKQRRYSRVGAVVSLTRPDPPHMGASSVACVLAFPWDSP